MSWPDSEMLLRVGAARCWFFQPWRVGVAAPRRMLAFGRARWPHNLGILVLVDSRLVRLLVPTAAVGMALLAARARLGLLTSARLPFWLAAAPALSRSIW